MNQNITKKWLTNQIKGDIFSPQTNVAYKQLDSQGGQNGDHMKYKEEILKMLELVDEIYLRYLYKLIKEMIAK